MLLFLRNVKFETNDNYMLFSVPLFIEDSLLLELFGSLLLITAISCSRALRRSAAILVLRRSGVAPVLFWAKLSLLGLGLDIRWCGGVCLSAQFCCTDMKCGEFLSCASSPILGLLCDEDRDARRLWNELDALAYGDRKGLANGDMAPADGFDKLPGNS